MNEDQIGIRHLRALSVLLELRSLTRAAEVIGTNQSTMSKTLAKLRSHCDDPLFVRVGLSMNPTPRALALAEPLRNLLAVSDVMRSSTAAFDPATSKREFKVLVTEVGMVSLIPLLMRRLHKAGDHLRIAAVPLDARQVAGKLETEEADVAIGAFPREVGNLKRQKLYADVYVSVARKGHPRITSLSRQEQYFGERHIAVTASSTGNLVHQQLEAALVSRISQERIQLRLPSFVACAFAVSETDAVGVMPERLARYLVNDLPLEIFQTPFALPRIEISQIWHERVDRDAGHRWLRRVIFDLLKSRETVSRNHSDAWR